MFTKYIAASATVLIGVALSLVAVAAPASAQETAISPAAVCSTSGYSVTWSVTNSDSDAAETITASDSTLIPVGTTVLQPSQTVTFTEDVAAPTAETITLTGTWADPQGGDDVVATNSGTLDVRDFPTCSTPGVSAPSVSTPGGPAVTASAPSVRSLKTAKCIPNSAVSYTYDSATNSGDITVADVKNSTGVLCHPFYVTATSWRFVQDSVWPQARDVVQKLPKISTPGTYHYAAAVTCGQGDIYASFTEQPDPTPMLNAADDPFIEHFLHDMGFSGTYPTSTLQATGCNVVTPASPTATSITSCGVYGSVSVPADSAEVSYSVMGSGNQGDYVVTATIHSPYTLAVGATTTWTFHLGTYQACAVSCSAVGVGSVSTNLNPAGWTYGESLSGGHHEYVASGLRVWTDGATATDKSAGYVATDFPLTSAGDASLTFSNTSGGAAPGLNLTVYVNGAYFGNLVKEPLYPQWWSSHAVDGVPAGQFSYQKSYGSLNDYLFAWAQKGITNVQVRAVGYSLGSGALGDGIITQISADCVNYSFTGQTYGPAVDYRLGVCYPNGGNTFSSKNLYFEFDNSASDVPVTFTVPAANISATLQPHTTQEVEGTPIWNQGGGYDVYADGLLLKHLTIPSYTGCLTVTPSDPTVLPELCTDGLISNGSITVDLNPALVYSITGVDNATSIPVVSDHVTPLSAGTYLVSVAATDGFVLSGDDAWPFTLEVLPALGCDIPTLAIQPVNVTSANASCAADGSQKGSITVGQVQGVDFTPFVQYSIDGAPVSQITTAVAPGTYDVTAAPMGTDSLEAGPNTRPDGTAEWTVVIASAVAVCADLKTLAITGTNDGVFILLAILLLQLGVALLAVRFALGRRRPAGHRAN